MPGLAQITARIQLMASARLPDKPVRRTVRGIELTLPRAHGLPYFARSGTPYLENLASLARSLAGSEGTVGVLDIGANVGDTARLVLAAAPGWAVCVEPDPKWHSYLSANVGAMGNVAIEHSVLVAPGTAHTSGLAIARADVGSSIVQRTDAADGLPTITTDELLERYPQLGAVRLVKSDTDGYDVMLVQAVTQTFAPTTPVIFFEFDPRPTRMVMPEIDPASVWTTLLERGYEQAVVWDNGGLLIGAFATGELPELAGVFDATRQERGYGYWDVAVAHRDDAAGLAALRVAEEQSRRSGAVRGAGPRP